jgi:capsular exopolysaccharide synthesis family protein
MGTILGVALALLRGLLDRTVKTPDDVEKIVGATCLGLVPAVEGKTLSRQKRRDRSPHPPELLVNDEPLSSVAEAARTVRTSLLFMSPDKPFRTLLVTSAGPSEGKTTIACYIATAMAQAGKRVLLIDCDLRRPRVHRIFGGAGRELGPGLTTTLLEEGAGDPVVPTVVPNLSIVPAGPIPPNPSELLHSEKFKQFLAKMQLRFDEVIIDSPPVVAVTDATILSTLVDGTVLVVRAHKTRKDFARHGYRLLTDVGANVAGVLLNAVDFGSDEYKYSYQYYRRADYYGTPGDRRASTGGAPAAPPS